MVLLTEIGTLVSIVKGLLDLGKSGASLLEHKDNREALQQFQQRIGIISEQMQNSIVLAKMLPLWFREYDTFNLFDDNLNDEKIKSLETKLRSLIKDSVHDHFSSAFFHTNFNTLPTVSNSIDKFRDQLKKLEAQINYVPPGNAAAWLGTWAVIKVRMHDLRLAADEVARFADQAQADLIKELREASQVTASASHSKT